MSEKVIKIGKLLSDEMIRQLSNHDFNKKEEGIFFREYGDEMYIRLGLNKSESDKDYIKINLMLGVGNNSIEKLLNKLKGTKFSANLYSTFSSNIGGFTEENRVLYYEFHRETLKNDVERCVTKIIPIIELAMKAYSDVGSIRSGLEKYPPVQLRTERLILTNYILGNIKEAKEMADLELENKTSEHEVMQKKYQVFYDSFKQHLLQV